MTPAHEFCRLEVHSHQYFIDHRIDLAGEQVILRLRNFLHLPKKALEFQELTQGVQKYVTTSKLQSLPI